MSDFETPVDMFEEEIPESVKNAPKHHFAEYTRPNQLGSVKLRMVKKHALWGDHLWNAGQWLAGHFDRHPELVKDKSVIELGAGAGVPSVISALNGARLTIVTDYPDPELIENLRWNLDENVQGEARSKVHERGFLWGAEVDELTALNSGNKFDIVILCDLLFNHSEHTRLLKSCQDLLAPNGTIWCVFTHYLPHKREKDLKFLEMAREANMVVELVGKHMFDQVMFENDRGDPEVRKTCHICKITLP